MCCWSLLPALSGGSREQRGKSVGHAGNGLLPIPNVVGKAWWSPEALSDFAPGGECCLWKTWEKSFFFLLLFLKWLPYPAKFPDAAQLWFSAFLFPFISAESPVALLFSPYGREVASDGSAGCLRGAVVKWRDKWSQPPLLWIPDIFSTEKQRAVTHSSAENAKEGNSAAAKQMNTNKRAYASPVHRYLKGLKAQKRPQIPTVLHRTGSAAQPVLDCTGLLSASLPLATAQATEQHRVMRACRWGAVVSRWVMFLEGSMTHPSEATPPCLPWVQTCWETGLRRRAKETIWFLN